MSTFESKDAYRHFAEIVRTERRFVFDGKAGQFLDAVRAGSKSRVSSLKAGRHLYRAQIGSEFGVRPSEEGEEETGFEEEIPLPDLRMIPDSQYIKHGGRANPPGFAYLYLATTAETALAEIRPSLSASVTLALFQTQRDVNLVVCRAEVEDWGERLFEENPSVEKIGQWVWNDISRAFAHPVNREDQMISYLPTQIIAEVFKAEGFDGVAYRSSLERGMNVVLFDVCLADLIRRHVYALKRVRYDSKLPPTFTYTVKMMGLANI